MIVATLTSDAAGADYPQTPARVNIGVWCSQCHGNSSVPSGTRVSDDLDTYVATVSTLEIINYNPAKQYTYDDMSDSASSVCVIPVVNNQKLKAGAIAGIVIGALAGALIIVGGIVYGFRCRNVEREDPGMAEVVQVSGGRTNGPAIADDSTISPTNEQAPVLLYPEHGEISEEIPESQARTRFGQPCQKERIVDLEETLPGGRLGQPLESLVGGRLGSSLKRFSNKNGN